MTLDEILMGDRPYKPAPLSPRQKNAAFRDVGASGAEIAGEFVDGYERSSYTMTGRGENANVRVFLRHDTDWPTAARMLRAMADRLQEQRF